LFFLIKRQKAFVKEHARHFLTVSFIRPLFFYFIIIIPDSCRRQHRRRNPGKRSPFPKL
jgi:hypothetical protein